MTVSTRVGDTIAGRYRLDHETSATAVGVLYDATDRALSRRVAVELALHLEHPPARVKWARDAMTVHRLKGDHVLRILDVGALEDGTPFVVREIASTNLAEELASHGPLPVSRAVGWTLEACEAVAEAHAMGIAHGSLRLDDVYMTSSEDRSHTPRVKVAWSGVVRAERATREHVASDIAALGAMLQILVSGQPVSPIERTDAAKTLPREVSHVVARALAVGDDVQFRNVSELARALSPHAPPGHDSALRVTSLMARAGIVGAPIFAPEVALPEIARLGRATPDVPPPLVRNLVRGLAPRPRGRSLTFVLVAVGVVVAVVGGRWLVRADLDLPPPPEDPGMTQITSGTPMIAFPATDPPDGAVPVTPSR